MLVQDASARYKPPPVDTPPTQHRGSGTTGTPPLLRSVSALLAQCCKAAFESPSFFNPLRRTPLSAWSVVNC